MRVVAIQDSLGLQNLRIQDRPDPKPAAGQVLVRMRACSLNYRDLLVVTGLYNPKLKLPFIPLSDGAGEVVAVGDGVTRCKVGDRVAGAFMQNWVAGELTDAKAKTALGGALQGVLAEHCLFEAEGIVHVPPHLSYEEAATLPCAAVTAWNGLVTEGKVKSGDTVLIQGTGGVSLFALQFAKLAGARVIATSSSDAKLERVKALGADAVLNYKTVPDWEEKARALTGGAGVDHVVEVGGAGTLPKSLRAVRSGGAISLIGVLSGHAAQFNPMPILMKHIRVQGIFVGSREVFEAMNRAICLHQLKPVVDRVFDFDQAAQALAHMEAGAHFGKIVIRVG